MNSTPYAYVNPLTGQPYLPVPSIPASAASAAGAVALPPPVPSAFTPPAAPDWLHTLHCAAEEACAERDIEYDRAKVYADNKVVRLPLIGRNKSDLDGAVCLFSDMLGGWVQNFTQDEAPVCFWFGGGEAVEVSPEELARRKAVQAAIRQQAAEERAERQKAGRAGAHNRWQFAFPAPADHGYLAKKSVRPHMLRCDGNALIVPIFGFDDAEIMSTQRIFPDSQKRFEPGAPIKGGFYCFHNGTVTETVLICEGWATGASLHEATGWTVYCAMMSSNMETIAAELAKRYPGSKRIICGDSEDQGRRCAMKAAAASGSSVVFPEGVSDFNDLHVRDGLAAVKTVVIAAPQPTPIIKYGRIVEMTDQAHEGLIAASAEIYAQISRLVRPVVYDMPASDDRKTRVPVLVEVNYDRMHRELAQYFIWQKYDARTKKDVITDPPTEVSRQIINALAGGWKFRPIVGVIGAQTMRRDGSLLIREGYDAATGLILASAPAMPPVKDYPNHFDAGMALAVLKHLLREFPFTNTASLSVALSMLMTPILRGAMSNAPLHVVSAFQAGSGKSYLQDLAAAISIGDACPVMSMSLRDGEMDSRVGAALMTGQPLIAIDNVNGPIGGDMLCQAITAHVMEVRQLGFSKNITITNRACFFANGNNISIMNDLQRRTIRASLDPAVARPELRTFTHNPFREILADRGKYIAAILTIARAYVVAARPGILKPVANFDDWSNIVRSALVWLGETDPMDTMATVMAEDPTRGTITAFLAAYAACVGVGPECARTASDIVRLVHPVPIPQYAQIREVMATITTNNPWEPREFGKWLNGNHGRINGNYRLNRIANNNGHKWFVERI